VQVNAEKRGIWLDFSKNRAPYISEKIKQGEAPDTFRKVKLSQEQKDSLKDGRTVYVSGLKSKSGQIYSGYITLNKQHGKMDFMFPDQYKEALNSGKAIPDNQHRTQIAVNSEGKTNEVTKSIGEPLKQGQTQPTEKQAEKLSNDKDKLQFIAKYGYEGVSNYPKSDSIFTKSFMEKYNLKADYGDASTLHRNSVFADTVAGTDSMLADAKKYSDKMKNTASEKLANQEQKQENKPKVSRGRKM